MPTKTLNQPPGDSEKRPTRQQLQTVLDGYQSILGDAEHAKSGDPVARRKVLAAIERLRGLYFELDKQARRENPKLLPCPDPAVFRWPVHLIMPFVGWPDDALRYVSVAQIESLLQTSYHAGMHRSWRESIADLSEATVRLVQILGTQPGPAVKPEPAPMAKRSLTKKAKALAALVDHPDWTDEQIANEAGCHPKSLYRMKGFASARQALRSGREQMPRGRKDVDTGAVEAWEDEG